MHYLDGWIKREQFDVFDFIISLFNASTCFGCKYIHPQELATYLLSYFMVCIALVRCVLVLRCGLAGVVWYTTHEITQQISRKLLKMDVLTSETCWALNNEIIKEVTSSWSLFIQQRIVFFFRLLRSAKDVLHYDRFIPPLKRTKKTLNDHLRHKREVWYPILSYEYGYKTL